MIFSYKIKGLKEVKTLLEEFPRKFGYRLKYFVDTIVIDEIDRSILTLTRSETNRFVRRAGTRRGILGGLYGSFLVKKVNTSRSGADVIISSDVPWATVHDDNLGKGYLTSHGKKMTVPLSGVSYSNEDLKGLMAAGRTFTRKDIIFLKTHDKDEPYIPIFALRRRVKITPQFYIDKALNIATPRVVKAIEDMIDEEFSK